MLEKNDVDGCVTFFGILFVWALIMSVVAVVGRVMGWIKDEEPQ